MEKIEHNILAQFCIKGTDEESFRKTLKWVDGHTVYKEVATEDIRILSLQSHKKKEGQYEATFLLIDPYAPYAVMSENLFFFNTKKIKLGKDVMDQVLETGFMFEIEGHYYLVSEETIHSIGTLLDCHGKMLKEPFLGRDLCLAEAIIDLEQMGIIYRENSKKGLKNLISVFGNRAIYHTMETLVNNCFHMMVNAQELEMHKWSVNHNGADIYMDYPKYSFTVDSGDEWQCGIHMCIKSFSGTATQIFWYARQKERYLYLRSESIKHTTKNMEPVRKQIRTGFYAPFQQIRNTMAKMNGVIDIKRAMNAYELRGTCMIDVIEKSSGLFKATGSRVAYRIKVQMNGKLITMDQISLYDMFLLVLEYTEKNSEAMKERYRLEALRAMAVLPESMLKNLTKYLVEKKTDQIAGQMSFDFVMNE